MRAGIRLSRAGTSGASRRGSGGAAPSRSEALASLARRFERAGIDSPEHDAEAILLRALHVSRADLWSEPHAPLTSEESEDLAVLAERRSAREPLQLLLGTTPFCSATLDLERGVFLPRPETEGLVEATLRAIHADRGRLLELGTGTGAIAIALLHALPEWSGEAVDRSQQAVRLARKNAARNGIARRLHVLEGDFRDAGTLRVPVHDYDLVVSNPPYVRSGEIPGLMPEVKDHDPIEALDGGPDGLDAVRDLARGIPLWLRPGGVLAVEIGADQADDSQELMRPHLEEMRVLPDLAGRPRVLLGTRRR